MKKLSAGIMVMLLGACATAPGDTTKNDPFEGFNRNMLAFNLAVDDNVLSPAASGYRAVTPQWGRDRVSDFFQNLGEPVTFVNDVLQGEGERALQTGFRFTINSTVGLGGLFDIAEYEGLPAHKEDFGQTLAVWGVDSGPYIVMPLLGPTNPRDLVGLGADRTVQPTSYIRYSRKDGTHYGYVTGINILQGVNARAGADAQIKSLKSQPEPYIALRDLHTKRRNAEISNGRGQNEQDVFEELPDFDENF